MRSVLSTILFVLALSPLQVVADDARLEPGEYEIQMRLELPHLEDMGASKTATACLTGEPPYGLVVLSDNNPLAKCPISNVRRADDALTFDIICDGGNQGVASGVFALGDNRFTGVITMKMGGKNMTMTERQIGRRVGACPHSPRS